MARQSLFLMTAAALLASCGQQAGDDTTQATRNAAPADGAEAPAASSGVAPLVYPGSQRTGNRFTTSDPIDRVVAWYRDEDQPMRERGGQTWAVDKPERRDGGYLVGVTIIDGEEGQRSVIYLSPRADGGTDGRIRLLTDEEIKSGVKL